MSTRFARQVFLALVVHNRLNQLTLLREGGLEPPPLSRLDPKSSASASSATRAPCFSAVSLPTRPVVGIFDNRSDNRLRFSGRKRGCLRQQAAGSQPQLTHG